ncbi:hypothetical protein KIK06_24990 [Nocardiopsis sp. EMB25]|uniref:hypothetical protein n=1 Tax=Nocardiopsis sp. EMB25 TaxID=2835867 RepID=UPI002283BE6E|nr:hypothetical protein [Nocardiopsis sp. EMB25]MCY9787146.1 hypothetical protein [Nocardiopsis sp. EMB25]
MARLGDDGVTVLVPVGGTLEDGTKWDAARRLSPGDDGYDEALAAARTRARLPRTPRPEPSEADVTDFVASMNRE